MGELLLEKRLQRIVVGMRRRIFIKDASECRCPIGGATVRQRIRIQRLAIGRRKGAQPDEGHGISQCCSSGYDQAARTGIVRQMEPASRNDCSSWNGVSAVLTESAARARSQSRI